MQGDGMQSSTGSDSGSSSITGLSEGTISNAEGRSSGLAIMTEISQSPMNNSPGEILSQNCLFANAQRQLQTRQQQHQQQVVQQKHQQHSQAQQQQQLHDQHQLQLEQQQAILRQTLQEQSYLQSSILQQQQQCQQQSHLQQQQPFLQQSQLQPSQQSISQSYPRPFLQLSQPSIVQQAPTSILQPSHQSALQQTQQTTVQKAHQFDLLQHPLSVLRQQQSRQSVIQQQPSSLQQQRSSMVQQSIIQPQQQFLGQGNNVSSMQQQKQQHQLQQCFQSKTAQDQQTWQQSSSLLQTQAQQLQQQQLLSQLKSQPPQLQKQQLSLQQPNSIQQKLQRLQPSSGLLQQQQSSIEQQKQLLQQTVMLEASSSQAGQSTVVDSQEKVYRRLQGLKAMYFQQIKELFTRISLKCEQPMAAAQTEKLKQYRDTLYRIMQYFHVQKSHIPQGLKEDHVDAFGQQIVTILNVFKQTKSASQQQGQRQLQSQTGNQVPPMREQPQPQPHISQMQQREKHVNQLQQISLQASAASMQSSNVTSMQNGFVPLLQQTSMQTSEQNIQSRKPGANLNPTQGTDVSSLQQSPVNLFQPNNNVNPLQKNNLPLQQNNISSIQQISNNVLHQNSINPLQSNVSALQQQQQQQALKLRVLQFQQYKNQLHQLQFHHQLLQQQQQQQWQQHLPQRQQQLHQLHIQRQTQLHAQQSPVLQQMSDLNDESKAKQDTAVEQAFMQQPHQQQQLKPRSSLSVSSPDIPMAASSQVSQQPSPQADQQSLVASSLQAPKAGTPLQPAALPFVTPPSMLPAQSPLTEDAEKQSSAILSLSNAGNDQGPQQPATALSHAQSLAIGMPGISASPPLADFSPNPGQNHVSQDGHQTVSPGLLMVDKCSTAEAPTECLVKILNSMSPKTLDRIGGSAPGNGFRAAVGQDMVATKKRHLQGRNLMSHDSNAATKKMKHCMSSMHPSAASSAGSVTNSLQQHNNLESPEMETTASSKIKGQRFEMGHAVQDEIQEINQQLIVTRVEVSEHGNDAAVAAAEGRDGIVVKFSYNAVALSPEMKSHYKSTRMLPISPLCLLIPVDYPNCSPVLLDKVPNQPWDHDDLSSKAKAKFSATVCNLQQPVSLTAMAKAWEGSVQSVIAEYAHQSG